MTWISRSSIASLRKPSLARLEKLSFLMSQFFHTKNKPSKARNSEDKRANQKQKNGLCDLETIQILKEKASVAKIK